ncbi:MAG: polysaccharide deacetylase family protein [Candidatus Levyibacteriota bacterium]
MKKKKVIKKSLKKNFMIHPLVKKLLIPVVLIFLLGVGSVYLFFSTQLRPVVETKKTEQRKIPKEVVKNTLNQASVSATFRVPILLYHYVEYVKDKGDTIRQSLDIYPSTLDAQIKTLQDAGYTFMTASELGEVIDGREELPLKPVLLTFDDGHWDLYTDVLPILEKYHVKATAYIISGFINGSDFLTSDELQKVIDSGLVEIGAHTVHHIGLAGKLLPVVQYEVSQSKKDLETKYNLHVVSFAYPGGSFDQQAIDAVKAAGYTNAVSTVPGIEQTKQNRLFLYRIRPGGRSGQTLLDFLQQESFKPW